MIVTTKLVLNVVGTYMDQDWEKRYGCVHTSDAWKELQVILNKKLMDAGLKLILMRSHGRGLICVGIAVPKEEVVRDLVRKHLSEPHPGVVYESYVLSDEALDKYGPTFAWPPELSVELMSEVVEI